MGRSNRNQTFERVRWHQVDCDYGCRASRLESAIALRNSASFRDYGPANGGQQTFDQVRRYFARRGYRGEVWTTVHSIQVIENEGHIEMRVEQFYRQSLQMAHFVANRCRIPSSPPN